MIKDWVKKNRSYRRFYEDVPVEMETLLELVDLARISSSASNKQPLKFAISTGQKNQEIFDCLGWAGYLTDWKGPEEGERPTAYIVVLLDKSISTSAGVDIGIACQSILLGATEKGLGGCMFGSANKQKLSDALGLKDNLEPALVVALGKPKEIVILEDIGEDGDIKYWRDAEQIHHVPKRLMDDIVYRLSEQ